MKMGPNATQQTLNMSIPLRSSRPLLAAVLYSVFNCDQFNSPRDPGVEYTLQYTK